MKSDGLIILKYQNNFADNMTSLAYGKILENVSNRRCYFENITKDRNSFESKMSDFNIDYDFVSSARVNEITSKAFNKNKMLINESNIKNEIKKNRTSKNKIVDLKCFNIEDIPYISDEIKEMFSFKNNNFIVNYDILEKIVQSNSIGLYINKNDIKNEDVDFEYIKKAVSRLNKYIKQPKLFVFSSKSIKEKLDVDMNNEILELYDWREEFLFLKSCRHKILCSSINSYSEGFWASILGNKDYSITVYNKLTNKSILKNNWIAI